MNDIVSCALSSDVSCAIVNIGIYIRDNNTNNPLAFIMVFIAKYRLRSFYFRYRIHVAVIRNWAHVMIKTYLLFFKPDIIKACQAQIK